MAKKSWPLGVLFIGGVAALGYWYYKDYQQNMAQTTAGNTNNTNQNMAGVGGQIALDSPSTPLVSQATAAIFAQDYVPSLPTSSTGFTSADLNYGSSPVQPGLEAQMSNGYAVTQNAAGDVTVIPGLGSNSRLASNVGAAAGVVGLVAA